MNDSTLFVRVTRRAGALAIWLVATGMPIAARADAPRTVYFPSADGKTELVGYLFEPIGPARHPAIVMLHGRGGPYSINVSRGCTMVGRGVQSPCSAATLSKRHQMWGEYWVEHGYVALLVDSFGPRGRGHGYARGSHNDPDRDEVNERTVRPLDAIGALAYLRERSDIRPSRIMIQGWSNGASTTLNVMERQAQAGPTPDRPHFRAALVFYPGCGPAALLSQHYRADTDILAFLGSDDEEVSSTTCAEVLRAATTSHGRIEVVWYQGATHDFDDPGKKRQSVPANRAAKYDAMRRSAVLFEILP
jgi:dienelactone hydrolase